jgi:hypothetical protein
MAKEKKATDNEKKGSGGFGELMKELWEAAVALRGHQIIAPLYRSFCLVQRDNSGRPPTRRSLFRAA